jgi:hypothetical protein
MVINVSSDTQAGQMGRLAIELGCWVWQTTDGKRLKTPESVPLGKREFGWLEKAP